MANEVIPTIGRIVNYRMNDATCYNVMQQRQHEHIFGNAPQRGEVYPAMIVRVWGQYPGASVQLQVFLDGPDTYWATSVYRGDDEGQWSWPIIPSGKIPGTEVRVPEAEVSE